MKKLSLDYYELLVIFTTVFYGVRKSKGRVLWKKYISLFSGEEDGDGEKSQGQGDAGAPKTRISNISSCCILVFYGFYPRTDLAPNLNSNPLLLFIQ